MMLSTKSIRLASKFSSKSSICVSTQYLSATTTLNCMPIMYQERLTIPEWHWLSFCPHGLVQGIVASICPTEPTGRKRSGR